MNKRLVGMIAVACLTLMLPGCDGNKKDTEEPSKPKEVVHTVGWYMDHPEEIRIKFAECISNPGELKNTPNCINANEAKQNIALGRSRPDDVLKAKYGVAAKRIMNADQQKQGEFFTDFIPDETRLLVDMFKSYNIANEKYEQLIKQLPSVINTKKYDEFIKELYGMAKDTISDNERLKQFKDEFYSKNANLVIEKYSKHFHD